MKVKDKRFKHHHPKSIALVTGGFDPLHSGHIQYLKAAAELADYLIVGVNSDEWLTRKKGNPFLPIEERISLLEELYVVDEVIQFNDDDETACNAIEKVKNLFKDPYNNTFHIPIIFCNGGDRTAENIPEQERYRDDVYVSFKFGVGGENKKNSSSQILREYRNARTERPWGYYRVVHELHKNDTGNAIKVKELVIEPGKSLSNQRHQNRYEMWFVMRGKCLMNGKTLNEYEPGIIIRPNEWHKAENPFQNPCHILECQFGSECIESDIEREPIKKANENRSHYYIGLSRGQEDDGYPD